MAEQSSTNENSETSDEDNVIKESLGYTSELSEFKMANLCILVIFGITGDLTKRLLYPALCNLGSRGLLEEKFCIVGVAQEKHTDASLRSQFKKNIQEFVPDKEAQAYGLKLLNNVYYIQADFDDKIAHHKLKDKLEALSKEIDSQSYLFYYAVPPALIETLTKRLHQTHLLTEEPGAYFRRIVVEKPFGHDYASAKALNQTLLSMVNESQIYRIDHFLGKETVRNLLAFRFSNGIFEPIWNRRYIDNIQITVAETLGVEQRASYYESAGALRDMVPNHLFQVLSLIAMEPPVSFSAEYIANEKAKVFHSIQSLSSEQVFLQCVRGQYNAGHIGSREVVAYRSEKNVDPHSHAETYVALKLYLDNWRWLHVPFYVRTGKRLKSHVSEIDIQFKTGPSTLFEGSVIEGAKKNTLPNLLRITIQPDEGISLRFNAKVPGPQMQLGQVKMSFKYSDYFGIKLQTGYETILYDCMNGDKTLFNTAEMIETSWKVIQPILDVWGTVEPHDFPNYNAGTWGPKAAEDLLKHDGREWLL